MTWVEVKSALAAGKTTALIYTGGVEERGLQNANGGHGGGQPEVYASVAHQLDDQYKSQGLHVHVYYCDQVYKANTDVDRYLTEHGFPSSLHGGVPDTSELMFLDHDHSWVRRSEVKRAVCSPVVDGQPALGSDGPKNGIIGDARRSTVALGRRLFQMKVDYAVRQSRQFWANDVR